MMPAFLLGKSYHQDPHPIRGTISDHRGHTQFCNPLKTAETLMPVAAWKTPCWAEAPSQMA